MSSIGKDVEIIILDERSCRSPDVSAPCSNDLVPTLPPQLRAKLTTDTHANLINRVFVDRFADPQPIAQEFITGPVAEFTFEEAIQQFATSFGVPPNTLVQGLNTLLDLVGV